MLKTMLRHLFARRICRYLLVLNTVALLLLVMAIAATTPAQINTVFESANIHISTDRAWVLLPRQCVNVSWIMEGVRALAINDREKSQSGTMDFCPTLNATSLTFEITAANGEAYSVDLHIQDLPAAVVSTVMLLFLLLPFCIAIYYFATLRVAEPILLDASPILAYVALLLICLLIQTARPFTIEGFMNNLASLLISLSRLGFGLVLAGIVFFPLALQSLRWGFQNGLRADFVVLGSFFVFNLLLYLPFGFESIGQQESWAFLALSEGRHSKLGYEIVSRFWRPLLDFLANVISAGSFAGYHIQTLFMFWGISVFVYGILRRLKVAPTYAFLATMLAVVYPVNSHLMSLRSILHIFSIFALFISIYFALECRDNVSRLRLLGLWLALSFNVVAYQNAFVIIFLVPILWWWRRPRWTWRNFNLTAIWFVIPAAYLIYIFLLTSAGSKIYGMIYLSRALRDERTVFENLSHYLGVVGKVYLQTFLHGWQEALNSLGLNIWMVPTLVTLVITGAVAVYLSQLSRRDMFPTRQQVLSWLLAGLLFILASIAVLMWFEKYQRELWRLYIYVPFGAAIVVVSLALLLVSLIKNVRIRQAITICLCLLLMVPATSRLFVQHAHFNDSANAKAKILLQIVEQVPRFKSDARLVLATAMSLDELSELGIAEMWTHMFDSAIFILYGEDRPMVSSLCILGADCSTDDIDKSLRQLNEDTDYSDIVIFRLADDLSVELLHELPPELGGANNVSYKPERLIDTTAPIPPRSLTMLASAYRD